MQRFRIKLGVDARHLQQRLDLRRERKPVALVRVVERFHSKMIARHEQTGRAGAKIADRESEHSVQPLDAIRPFFS